MLGGLLSLRWLPQTILALPIYIDDPPLNSKFLLSVVNNIWIFC